MPKQEKNPRDENTINRSSITILIHGTYSRNVGYWHRPRSRFHRFLKENYFPDVYSGSDFFRWSGDASDEARKIGAEELVEWCSRHPADEYNLISHSHGTNVANLATNLGIENVNKLIHLSPPVWGSKPNYLPNMNHVKDKRIYNFHPRIDFIVTHLARAAQNYNGTRVDQFEQEYVLLGGDHWAPVRVRNWTRYNIGEIVNSYGLYEENSQMPLAQHAVGSES